MSKIYWTQKTEERIDVDEMSIDHLRNVLKMIIRTEELKKADKFFRGLKESKDEWNTLDTDHH